VEKGQFLAIVGPSGSGKSTLLHTVGGLLKPDAGVVLWEGLDIYAAGNVSSSDYRRHKAGFVFQQFHLVPYLTVYENIRLACSDKSCRQNIGHFLQKCGLTPLRDKFPSELSVGEKQRAAFVRAIVGNPHILLADEPTGNLDPANSRIIMDLIGEYHRGGGTVLLVSHDPESAGYAGTTVSLESGKLV
jgi:putative ABC transport system ATP-binding protein